MREEGKVGGEDGTELGEEEGVGRSEEEEGDGGGRRENKGGAGEFKGRIISEYQKANISTEVSFFLI